MGDEALILWSPDVKSRLIEKWATEDEMFGWHHRLNGHDFEQTLGDSGCQRNLECCSPLGCKESEMSY